MKCPTRAISTPTAIAGNSTTLRRRISSAEWATLRDGSHRTKSTACAVKYRLRTSWSCRCAPQLPISLQPFTVAEFFPTPGLSDYYDPRQHAIALCYVVPIAGDCKPQDETLDVEWVDPSGDMLDTFVGQMANGYGTIVRQALAWTGK